MKSPSLSIPLALLLTACAHRTPRHDTVSDPRPLPRQVQADETTGRVSAGGPLSLEDSVGMALRRNRDLQVQAFEPLIQDAFLRQERAVFAAELFAEGSVSESTSSETARSTGEQFNVDAENDEALIGLRRDFPTGSAVEGVLRQTRDASNRAPTQQETRTELTLTQALLRGRGSDVGLAQVRQAELGVSVSIQELRAYTAQLVARTEEVYWRYALAGKARAITEQALAVAEQQLEEVRQRIAVGQTARNEEAAALAETARRRQVLIEARAREISRRLELLSLVSPGEPDADPDPSSAMATEPLPEENPAERLALADRLRPELAEARLRLEQGRLETTYTRNGVMPRLDFFANLAKTGFGERRSASADNWGDDTYEWQAGLRLLHELGEGSAKAEAREADLRYEQAKAALENLASLIGMEVRQALAELTRAHQQIGASAETRRLQEQTLQAEKERQEVGSSTSLLVAQAQRDLLSSQIAEQEALVAYRLALTRLWLAEGSLLERRGITVK